MLSPRHPPAPVVRLTAFLLAAMLCLATPLQAQWSGGQTGGAYDARTSGPGNPGQGDTYPTIVWIGTIATNFLYVPAKLIYAVLGGFTGGIGWILTGGDSDAANTIWIPTMTGTYLITPAMMTGDEEARFWGP